MTVQEFNAAMLPHWEAFQVEYKAAWELYGRVGFHSFRERAAKADAEYKRIAAELWAQVVL